MAEKTTTENLALAKELYSRASRNYLVKDYTEAADDFSKCTELYTEIYSPLADELGMPYLLYAKSLIALATQGENKLLDMPKDDDDNDDDDDEDDEENEDENGSNKKDDTTDKAASSTKTNGIANNAEKSGSDQTHEQLNTETDSPKPNTNDENSDEENNEDDNASENAENLQIAWEVLEMAVQIFERQGPSGLNNLAESYFELAGISFENSHFESAINDYQRSLEIRAKTNDHDLRVIAEIQYKIGLGYLILNNYDAAVKSLNEAKKALDAEIDYLKEKNEDDDNENDTAGLIKEIEEFKVEIENKIVEIEDEKTQSIDEVKKELTKLIGNNPLGSMEVDEGASSSKNVCKNNSSDAGAGSSSSNLIVTNKTKPSDISHLIKRKQADSVADITSKSPTSSSESKKPTDISHMIKRKQPAADVESPSSSSEAIKSKSLSPLKATEHNGSSDAVVAESSTSIEKIKPIAEKLSTLPENNGPDTTTTSESEKSDLVSTVDSSLSSIKRKQPDTIDAEDETPSTKRPSV